MSHTLQTLAIIIGVAMFAGAVVLVRHRFFPTEPGKEPPEDVAEYISMIFGVLYALVLGLSLISVWETNGSAGAHVQTEASALHETNLVAGALPPAQKQRVRALTEQYANHVVNTEWPKMVARENIGSAGWALLGQLRVAAQVPATATPTQQAAAQEVLAQLGTLDEARRGREIDVQSRLSSVLWMGLVVGGVLTLSFMFIFGIERSFLHVVMVMGLAGFIMFFLLLIQRLDAPFGDILGVDPEAFTRYFRV